MISDERYLHIMGVARLMKELALQRGFTDEEAEEMFILGHLHDIGYESTGVIAEHNKVGGEILRKNGYKYWHEVYYHGDVNPPYSSRELDLLNEADMMISRDGEFVEVDVRLEDIKKRYGEDSVQYQNAFELIKNLYF